jgi:hypothetical protein
MAPFTSDRRRRALLRKARDSRRDHERLVDARSADIQHPKQFDVFGGPRCAGRRQAAAAQPRTRDRQRKTASTDTPRALTGNPRTSNLGFETPQVDDRRLTTWTDWYRFARRELEYTRGEAVVYSNVPPSKSRTVRPPSVDRPAEMLVVGVDGSDESKRHCASPSRRRGGGGRSCTSCTPSRSGSRSRGRRGSSRIAALRSARNGSPISFATSSARSGTSRSRSPPSKTTPCLHCSRLRITLSC